MVRASKSGGLIRRNPGTTAFIVFVVGSFFLGYYAGMLPEPYGRTIIQCWALIGMWVLTHYNVKWISMHMKRQMEKDRLRK